LRSSFASGVPESGEFFVTQIPIFTAFSTPATEKSLCNLQTAAAMQIARCTGEQNHWKPNFLIFQGI
jgi:hypothetical protein